MATFLLACLLIVLLVRWIYLHNRLNRIESRIAQLEWGRPPGLPVQTTAPAPAAQPMPEPPVLRMPPAPPPPTLERLPPPVEVVGPEPAAPFDWEATLGGNWLNKAGVVLLVIGLSLALAYSFAHIGPLGRVTISLAVSLTMLIAGARFEPREPYRIFARGLLGGGWAGVYTTVYAMHAVKEALIIPSPVIGTALLIAVAAGMIVHSTRYRSQAVTGLAYFIAFGTLAIAEANTLSLVALVPLAASLLYIVHRFAWSRMALFGLIATYGVVAIRGDHGAPLWQAQTLFAIFWLVFESFDVLHPETWLLPLNATGFLGLSLLKWNSAAPHDVWMLLAAAAAAYLASAVARARPGKWRAAALLAAALAAAAIFQKLDRQWVVSALLVEAELVYLAGVRLKAPYLRWLGTGLFAAQAGRLLLVDMSSLPTHTWASIAAVDAVVFYANYAIEAADLFYGYVAAALLALVIGNEAPERYRSLEWLGFAVGSFTFGWWRGTFDFRLQGYLLGILGLTAVTAEVESNNPALWGALAFSYALALCAKYMPDVESRSVRWIAAGAATAASVALVWRLVAGDYLSLAWMALALVLFELGWRGWPGDFRVHSYAVAALAFFRCWGFNFADHAQPLLAAAIASACFFAAQVRAPRGSFARLYYSLLGTCLIALLLWYESSGSLLTVAWGIQGVALLAAGFPLRDRVLRLSGLALLMSCILKLFLWDLRHLETLPRIFSFIVLGLILVGVSWIYTRFRERVERFL